MQKRGQGWEQEKGRAVLVDKCQGCKEAFWTSPSGKDVLVSKSCSSGWHHLQTVKGARDFASDLFIPVLLFGTMG